MFHFVNQNGQRRGWQRRAWPRLAIAALITGAPFACTLTGEDLVPERVESRQVQPLEDAGGAGTTAGAGGAPAVCPSGLTCCDGDAACPEGFRCAAGICERAGCTAGEDLAGCELAPCSGPGCPEPPEPSASPTCTDGARNQDETDTDCGGGCSQRCSAGEACAVDSDCSSGVCGTDGCATGVGTCCQAPTCNDGVANGDEPVVDCGTPACGLCIAGEACTDDAQCESGACDETCRPLPGCDNAVLDGEESDVDCGGESGCARCADGDTCRAAEDCASGRCEDAVCTSCADAARNGDETDVDCGGESGCATCPTGSTCAVDGDCVTGLCRADRCVAPSCNDGVRNGTESAVDCGGSDASCPRCEDGAACALGGDCASGTCAGGRCVSCSDDVRNGAETDTDCGGPSLACARCQPGELCRVDGDCASNVCEDGRCCGGALGDCTRCAERLSRTIDCGAPLTGTDSTGVVHCTNFLQCLADNADVCVTRNAPGCSGDNLSDACPHNTYGGNAGTGLTRANLLLQNAGCQL